MKIIGRVEHVSFPEWNLFDLDAKIDTGAYTSSLHCHHIEKFEKKGKLFVRFNLLDPLHETYNDILFELPVYKEKTVKSSNGTTAQRTIVKTKMQLSDDSFDVELSLADRSEMKYPVLLGRKLLKKRFLVEVSKKYLAKKQLKKEIDL